MCSRPHDTWFDSCPYKHARAKQIFCNTWSALSLIWVLFKRRPNSSPEEVKCKLLWQTISLRPPPHHEEVNIICSGPVFWWVDNNSHHKTKWNSMGVGRANYSAFPASDTHSNRDKCKPMNLLTTNIFTCLRANNSEFLMITPKHHISFSWCLCS